MNEQMREIGKDKSKEGLNIVVHVCYHTLMSFEML